jgi:hypothetical protein
MAFLNDTGALVGADVEQALRNGRCDMTIALKAAAPDQASGLPEVWDLWIRYANADQLPEQLFRHWVEGLPAAGARS